ncbi:universal stress protein [Lactobacillaceae bacterium 24-114]
MENSEYKNILVAVDGSKATIAVLNEAIKSALHNHAHLDILTIDQVGQLTDSYIATDDLNDDQTFNMVKTTKERLEDLKKRAKDAGLTDVDVHIRFGNPKRVIAEDFPKDHHNDLIVMGTTGLSSVERFVLGSVTSYVERNAYCDVLVVRTEKQAKED